jgi:hypothetical protein
MSDRAFDVGRDGSIEAGKGELLTKVSQLTSIQQTNSAANSTVYTDANKQGSVNSGSSGERLSAAGTDSLFNPFRIFRYSKFGIADGSGYKVDGHKFTYNSNSLLSNSTGNSGAIMENRSNNPTATSIIEWANNRASIKTGPLYPYPYQLNDFLWCRHYGKIPNNRMLTLRRYPIPVEDNLAVDSSKLPLIPIAQAVTWWGGDTGNTLGNIFGMTYGLNWGNDLTTKVQDVAGNEISIDAAYETLGIKDETLRKAITAGMAASDPNGAAKVAGWDKKLQDWEKNAYGNDAAYWNRILGPVNIINSTKNRGVGYNFTHTIKLDFEYNLRSYGKINPKVAMLDLISNFLSLTYNNAEFYGGGLRYFRQTGVIIPPFNTDQMEKGNYIGALGQLTTVAGQALTQKTESIKEYLSKVGVSVDSKGTLSGKVDELLKSAASSNLANVLVAGRIAAMQQKPLTMRSMLDGRAVGEWHLMVGNPMNPLAVIGNLCLMNTTMSFSEELGEEDFPVSVKFTTTLEPGRPRAKQDIESMFNMGGGDLSFTALADPVSSYGSYGEYASTKIGASRTSVEQSAGDGVAKSQANNLANYFRGNIARAYGNNFAKSEILTDYFTNIVTKD